MQPGHVGADFAGAAQADQGIKIAPGKAKRLGRRATIREDWDDIKSVVMRYIVAQKFTQNPELMQMLRDTCTAELIEGNNWHDNVWGICQCPKCENTGQNLLGKILMEIRDGQPEK